MSSDREGTSGPARGELRRAVFVRVPALSLLTSLLACGSGAGGAASLADAAAEVAPDDGGLDGVAAPTPYPRPTYTRLSETGLFADLAAGTIDPRVVPFAPTHPLWSDGADKRRWIQLPPGTRIDTLDMDHWVFPVGTRLWKEFSRDGVPLETRLIERYGEGREDYWMGAFVWDLAQSDATLAADGHPNINGTTHDAPAQKLCGSCHRGEPGRVLGFSAIQLSRPGEGVTLGSLVEEGLLSDPPPADVVSSGGFPVPGDAPTAAALGYLHANCGHCHNKNGTSWPDTQMVMRLRIGERDPQSSELYTSNLGRRVQYWRGGAITLRVVPGQPEISAVTARMHVRGSMDQMPPLATEEVDDAGLALVTAWIVNLAGAAP